VVHTIINYVLLLLDVVIMAYAVDILIENKNKKVTLLFVTIYYLVISAKVYLGENVISIDAFVQTLAPIVLTTTLLRSVHRVKIAQSIALAFIYNMFVILVQIISYFIMLMLMNIIDIDLEESDFGNIVQTVYMIIMSLLLYNGKNLIKKLYTPLCRYIESKNSLILKSVKIIISGLLIIGMIYLSVNVYNYSGVYHNILIFVCIAMMVIMVIVIITYYEMVINNNKTRDAEEKAKLNKVHEDFVYTINKFGHSFNNLMQTIWLLVNCEDATLAEVRPVLKDILYWNEENKISNKLRFINLPNMMVASILSIKMEKADELCVNLMLDYDGKSKEIPMHSKDFIDMLNILLDNSIEAAHYADNKNVEIKLYFGDDKFSLEMSNRYTVDVNGVIMKYGESKGIGLTNVTDIVNNNNNIEMVKEMTDGIFKIKIDVYNNEFRIKNNEK